MTRGDEFRVWCVVFVRVRKLRMQERREEKGEGKGKKGERKERREVGWEREGSGRKRGSSFRYLAYG
jgi:hypothetical protein